jgi:hypothetical protein
MAINSSSTIRAKLHPERLVEKKSNRPLPNLNE